jgi:DNA sulfur modification protein DndE
MADRIFTSRESEEALNALRYATKIEYAALARLALAYSLKKAGADVPPVLDFSGKEIRRRSVFGDDEIVFRSILYLVHNRRFDNDDEFFSNRSICKDHIDHGIALLLQLYHECAQDENMFLQRLASEIELDRARLAGGLIPNLDIVVGTRELNNERVILELNNTARHANSHLAIMGKPGVGKTQLLLKILADIRIQSRYLTNFILFDYKGDIVENDRFLEVTRATTYRMAHQPLPVNPFVLEEYSESAILISAREKAESFASISAHFGTVQKGSLTEAIRRAYERRSAQEQPFPDFREVLTIVQEMYEADNRRDDSLIEILRDLSSFSLFWHHGSELPLIDRISERTMVIDLHELPVLKELVAYLVIERLYKEMAALPDSETREGRRALRTVLVIDEAHNYLSQKNPFLQKIIREGRSKGVVVFFASQSPNDYTQKFFDFKELLEFSLIFQCEGVSAAAVQDLLGCSQRTAKDLQVELARQRPFQVISKALDDDRDFTKFRAEPFFKAYQ